MRSRIALLLHAAVAATARDLDKCAGCAVVMRSLQKVLALEHLDEDKTDILSGGRLDGNGNRQLSTADAESALLEAASLTHPFANVPHSDTFSEHCRPVPHALTGT